MRSQLVPGVSIPDSDAALLLALEECRIGSGKGPSFTFAFKNVEGDVYRVVESTGYLEAAKLADEADKIGLIVERAFDPDLPDGVHGIYCQGDVTGHGRQTHRGARDSTDRSRRSRP